jgi:hypothetical protein
MEDTCTMPVQPASIAASRTVVVPTLFRIAEPVGERGGRADGPLDTSLLVAAFDDVRQRATAPVVRCRSANLSRSWPVRSRISFHVPGTAQNVHAT